MNENDILISHALDLKEKSANEGVITFTGFLSPEQRTAVCNAERKINSQYVKTFYFGGYDEAERTVALFIPAFYNVDFNCLSVFLEENAEAPVSLLRVDKDKFSSVSHRDYLGALMGLGLKRETVGDIITDEKGCYVFCLKTVSAFICNNLNKAGRAQLDVRVCSENEFNLTESKKETAFLSVASLRLDCVVAAAFKLSRSNAVSFIEGGTVFLNGIQAFKADVLLKEGDKLVLRGKGKVTFNEITGESKKGRIHINITRYI